MLARNETIFKWALYAGATAVFFLLQGALLQRITLWGVIPFVFPILVAVLGMYEGPLPASVYALTVGVLCDLLLPASIPCFYTLIFPAAGLCAALISQSLLPAGFLCGVVTSGLGGYYPSGLSVGTVEEVQLSDSGAASYAVLEPAADFDSLVEVFVIKSFDIQT